MPDRIIAARKNAPLIIGVGEGENFIASDIPAIIEYTKKRFIYQIIRWLKSKLIQ